MNKSLVLVGGNQATWLESAISSKPSKDTAREPKQDVTCQNSAHNDTTRKCFEEEPKTLGSDSSLLHTYSHRLSSR